MCQICGRCERQSVPERKCFESRCTASIARAPRADKNISLCLWGSIECTFFYLARWKEEAGQFSEHFASLSWLKHGRTSCSCHYGKTAIKWACFTALVDHLSPWEEKCCVFSKLFQILLPPLKRQNSFCLIHFLRIYQPLYYTLTLRVAWAVGGAEGGSSHTQPHPS